MLSVLNGLTASRGRQTSEKVMAPLWDKYTTGLKHGAGTAGRARDWGRNQRERDLGNERVRVWQTGGGRYRELWGGEGPRSQDAPHSWGAREQSKLRPEGHPAGMAARKVP